MKNLGGCLEEDLTDSWPFASFLKVKIDAAVNSLCFSLICVYSAGIRLDMNDANTYPEQLNWR